MSGHTTIKMSCKRGVYKPFDLVEINDEKRVITQIDRAYNDTLYLEPLTDFVAKRHIIEMYGEKITIEELIRTIATDFEERHHAVKKWEEPQK